MKRICLAISICGLAATTAVAGVLSPGLEAMLEGRSESEIVKVLVVMREQADPTSLDKALYAERIDFAARHRAVVGSLRSTAAASQVGILADLDLAKAGHGIEGYTSHWLVNALVVRGTIASVRALAARDDVERVEPDLEVRSVAPVSVKTAPGFGVDKAGFLAPGVDAINAPRVWHELGIDGTGTLVANVDSGVDVTHPALGPRWRGHSAPASECWLDIAGTGYPDTPVDLIGHGTHVMGTITGVTEFDTVGVAPGAQWIAANGAASPIPTFDNGILATFEWLADPDGDPATVDDVPDVVQNSWGVSPRLGPYLDCDSRWWDVLDNCEAAGVVLVWSAGNDGPGPSTLNSPADRASTPTNSFSVGSTNWSPPYTISSFSSRGPSECGGPFEIKPEVCAPGESIISAYPGGQYAYMDGTSMAGPHVAGVVALMRQANPEINVTTLKEILMETAVDLGLPGEDNTHGHGFIDAYTAVLTVLQDVGTVAGTVTDQVSGLPIPGVVVRESGGFAEATTADDGSYSLTLRAGLQDFTLEKFGYVAITFAVDVPVAGTADGDVSYPPAAAGTVTGIVRGPDGLPFIGASVAAINTPVAATVTGADGAYELVLPAYPEAFYDLTASAPGLAYDLRHLGLQGDAVQDFQLSGLQGDGFESGDFTTLPWQTGGDLPMVISSEEAHEGLLSARSGAIDHGQSSELALSYYVNGTAEISFWCMVESEAAYDVLVFSIDGVEDARWSGEVPWTLHTVTLQEGLYEFRWTYRKDASASHLRDAAWIDLVGLPGTGVQPAAGIVLSDDHLLAEVDAGQDTTVTFDLGNSGSYPLEYTTAFAAPTPWATVSPATGTIYPGSVFDLAIAIRGAGAVAGLNQAHLIISSNDPQRPDTTVTVDLTVHAVSAAGGTPPRRVALATAVPNPFNPQTEIAFSLPAASEVSLRVYDVSGRLVRTLVRAALPAGHHRASWDGRDERGLPQASAVYFARLQTDGATRIRSMTLLR